MIITRDKLRLVRLTEEHIELVRHWRNSPEIKKRMEYREDITAEQQKQWFKTIDNIYNNYFLIEANGTFFGLIYGADIDWDKRITNNGGIFIWDSKFLESIEVLQASILLTDLGYYLGMQKNYVKILKDNGRAIAFNKAMGYILLPGQEDVYNQKYELTPTVYFEVTEKIRQQFGLNKKIIMSVTPAECQRYFELIKSTDFENEHLRNIAVEIVTSE